LENIVAVELEVDTGEKRYFLTWGRIQEDVDPRPLEALILQHCHGYSLGGAPVRARLCDSLQEAAGAPYFYEALFYMTAYPIPDGPEYPIWLQKIGEEMARGNHLYYLGRVTWKPDTWLGTSVSGPPPEWPPPGLPGLTFPD